MATANEVLEQMEQHPELYASADVCIVDPVTRTISVPDAYRILGVESDESVKVVPFQCPKMVEDDVDLTDFTLYINYVNAGGDFDIYSIENVKESGENITFDWIIRRSVTARRGTIRFILCAKRSDDDGNIVQEWNTTINDECESLEGLEGAPSIADQFPDIIQQILEKLQEIIDGGGGTGGPVDQEQIQQAVNDYLMKNPPSGMTTEQQQQLTKNTNDITDLKSANDDFVVKIFNLASSVENVFKNVVFKSANTESFDYLSNLVQNLKPSEMVTIKYSLTNCTIDNNVAHIMKGSNFTATIIPDSGTEFQSLKVTMGGLDVTETVVIDKTINISNVTGDIIITAVSKQTSTDDGYEFLNYVYSSGNGDAYIDTDWIMTDLKEKIVVGVQLSETNPTSTVSAFLGVNADSAFSSIYTAIELGQPEVDKISVGWGVYQPNSNAFEARYQENLTDVIRYVSLTNGEQKLWEDEDMNSLYTGQFASNTQKYTMEASRIPPFPLWLFRSNIQDVAYQSATKKTYRSPGVKISCFKVYDGDGILIVNMRAAKRSGDGTIGFYDTVRKRFFENECDTGELIGG